MKKQIIVVEDEKLNIYLLQALLAKIDADVTYCENADEFYQKFNDQFDIILLDLKLGEGKSGKDILEDIRRKSSVPIIVQTAYADEEENCKNLGATGFITKPYNIEHLLSSLKNLLKL